VQADDPVKTAADALRQILENTVHQFDFGLAAEASVKENLRAATAACKEVVGALKRKAGRGTGRQFFTKRATIIVAARHQLEPKAAPSPEWRKTRETIEASFAAYDAARKVEERPDETERTRARGDYSK